MLRGLLAAWLSGKPALVTEMLLFLCPVVNKIQQLFISE